MIETHIIDMDHVPEEKQRAIKKAVVLGYFDSGHKGHQLLFKNVVDGARKLKLESCVFTFRNSPRDFFEYGDTERLSSSLFSFPQRLRFFDKHGIHHCAIPEMTQHFFNMTPGEFFIKIIKNILNASVVYAGENFKFGYRQAGDVSLLKRLGAEHGIGVYIVPLHMEDGESVSTTRIRESLKQEKYAQAFRMLGRDDFFYGEVIHGDERGATLGFPTANIEINAQCRTIPVSGVYVAKVYVNGECHFGVANIGHKPTFGDSDASVEVHLLDFDQTIYGKEIALFLDLRLREEIKFKNSDELISQIKCDIQNARFVISSYQV